MWRAEVTAFQYTPPKPPEQLMREHIAAMRAYASEIVGVMGPDSPIVNRIRSCAQSNEYALDRWERTALAAATGTAKTPKAVECEASQSGGNEDCHNAQGPSA
jgi:hypothetical protein